MLVPGIVVVGDSDYIGTHEIFVELRVPLVRTPAIGGCGDAESAQSIGTLLALNDEYLAPANNGRSHFGQRVRYDRHASGVPNPFTGPIRVRPFLAERLFALVVLYNEGPICILMLDALDDKGERAI